jgi:YbbR domain-containing protein
MMAKLARRGRAGRWISDALTENIGLKLVALVMAVALFYIVRGAEDASRTMYVEVVPTLPPLESRKVLISEVPDRVRLTLRGSRSILQSVRRQDIEPVQIDLTDTTRRYYYIEPTIFEMPPGVTIEQTTPASIPLTWAERTERRVAVSANLVGDPPPGLMVVEPVSVDPPRVMVEGPHTEVDPMSRVSTEPIDIGALPPGDHVRLVPIEALPVHTVVEGVTAVRVRFSIAPAIAERQLTAVGVSIVGGTGRILTRPSTVNVTLKGSVEEIERLDPAGVVAYVDVTELPPGVQSRLVPVRFRGLPEGVDVVHVEPAELLVAVLRAARRE